jgi:hypothetical protein
MEITKFSSYIKDNKTRNHYENQLADVASRQPENSVPASKKTLVTITNISWLIMKNVLMLKLLDLHKNQNGSTIFSEIPNI